MPFIPAHQPPAIVQKKATTTEDVRGKALKETIIKKAGKGVKNINIFKKKRDDINVSTA